MKILLLLTSIICISFACTNVDPKYINPVEKNYKDAVNSNSNLTFYGSGSGNIVDTINDSVFAKINVFFHIVSWGEDDNTTNINDYHLLSQIDILNDAFKGTNIEFVLANIDRNIVPEWKDLIQGSDEEISVKNNLRTGNSMDINIYTTTNDDGGWSSWPWDYMNLPSYDGIVLDYRSILNDSDNHLSVRKDVVHQVGHWLGIHHTFRGGCCDGLSCGDYILDTPSERFPFYGTGISRDTCPSQKNDPIENYMDFTNDELKTSFTYGQAQRMKNMWFIYRYVVPQPENDSEIVDDQNTDENASTGDQNTDEQTVSDDVNTDEPQYTTSDDGNQQVPAANTVETGDESDENNDSSDTNETDDENDQGIVTTVETLDGDNDSDKSSEDTSVNSDSISGDSISETESSMDASINPSTTQAQSMEVYV